MPTLLRSIHQVEITSRCNLRCVYCLHPAMRREKMDMTRDTWLRTLKWLQFAVSFGTQTELNMVGVGEPTLHPDLVRMVAEARDVLGPSRRILCTTNGLLMTRELAQAMQPYNIRWYVSLHRPEKAEAGCRALREAGLLEGIVADAVTGPHDWAGQVAWQNNYFAYYRDRPLPVCPYLQGGWGTVLANGAITTCCFSQGNPADGLLGYVWEDPSRIGPFVVHGLCPKCGQRAPTNAEAGSEPSVGR